MTAADWEDGKGGARGKIGQLSPYPPHRADLELMLDQAFVYMFFFLPSAFQRCVRLRPSRGTFGMTDVHGARKAEGTG